MRNPTAKELTTYCDMMANGKGAVAALEATGLSHAQADLAWYGDARNPQHVVPNSVKLPPVPGKAEPGYEVAMRQAGLAVATLRSGEADGTRYSWGQIAVLCGVPESAVRRYFKATGLDSAGTRKGRGGRWLADEPRYYTGGHKGVGVEDAAPRKLNPAEVAAKADQYVSVLPKATAQLKAQLGGAVRTAAKKQASKRQHAKVAS